jgi:hypothetical protein
VNNTYIDTVEKLQQQGIEALKQAQAAQTAAVNSFREIISNATAKLPGAEGLRNMPTVITQVTELNSTFAVKLIEQQNEYVNQLIGLLKSANAPAPTANGTADQA